MSAIGDASTGPVLPPGVGVGRHTYGHDERTFGIFIPNARIEVGAFCSIAPEARILAGSEHVTTRATTFPLNALLLDPAGGNSSDAIDRGTTVIGHDVWIGLGATILSGVSVGHGAVLGARAVVSKWVPPYAVVVGNPAQIVRYRFDAETRRRLLALGWWDWEDEKIRALKPWFMADVGSFLDEAERIYEPCAESDLARRLREAPSQLLTPHRRKAHVQGLDYASTHPPTADRMLGELEATIAGRLSTTAWRWVARYWRSRGRLRRRSPGDFE
jgi:acetyltransferase-like isoleucine patch superfamily enzyme